MNFLADECCPAAIVAALRDLGHDVVHVLEVEPGVSDIHVVSLANAQDRVLITADYDLGELIIRRSMPARGLMILAFGTMPLATRVARVLDVVGRLGERLRGHIVIVDPGRERFRAFPSA